MLPQCIEKCLIISDAWHTCTSEILLFKKLFTDGEKYYEGEEPELRAEREEQEKRLKRLDSEQIQNIDYKNIERLKMLEKLEEKEDKSFVMAPLCKLRNHCYTIQVWMIYLLKMKKDKKAQFVLQVEGFNFISFVKMR